MLETPPSGETLVFDSTFDVLDAPAAGTYENWELVAWLSRKSDHEYSEELSVPVLGKFSTLMLAFFIGL